MLEAPASAHRVASDMAATMISSVEEVRHRDVGMVTAGRYVAFSRSADGGRARPGAVETREAAIELARVEATASREPFWGVAVSITSRRNAAPRCRSRSRARPHRRVSPRIPSHVPPRRERAGVCVRRQDVAVDGDQRSHPPVPFRAERREISAVAVNCASPERHLENAWARVARRRRRSRCSPFGKQERASAQ